MALTELQLPDKAQFYRDIISLANELKSRKMRFAAAAEFINTLTSSDLDAMGVPSGAIRTDLVELKTVLNEFVTFFEGGSVTPTNTPEEVVDKLRTMLVV